MNVIYQEVGGFVSHVAVLLKAVHCFRLTTLLETCIWACPDKVREMQSCHEFRNSKIFLSFSVDTCVTPARGHAPWASGQVKLFLYRWLTEGVIILSVLLSQWQEYLCNVFFCFCFCLEVCDGTAGAFSCALFVFELFSLPWTSQWAPDIDYLGCFFRACCDSVERGKGLLLTLFVREVGDDPHRVVIRRKERIPVQLCGHRFDGDNSASTRGERYAVAGRPDDAKLVWSFTGYHGAGYLAREAPLGSGGMRLSSPFAVSL